MVDWLVIWGVTQAVGFAFKPVMEELAKDTVKELGKDFFKDSFKNVFRLPEKEPLDIAAGKAIKEFLQLIQNELEDADLSEEQLKPYTQPLKKFIKDKSVQGILGSAFQDDCQALDIKTLIQKWYQLDLLSLPDEFDWGQVGKRYLKKVKAIIRESEELRAILDSQNIEATAENTKELVGIIPKFDLVQYQEAIRERYGNLKLESLDTSGYAYNELKLWRMFTAQNVRKVHELLPQVHELPKEHLRQLKENNQLEADFSEEKLEQYKRAYVEQPIRSVLDVINNTQSHKYVVILGDPGSGKSTLLQYLALNWANSPLDNVISLQIPLLIELRTYMRNFDLGHCTNFLEFFHKSPGSICHLNQHQLDEQLKAGKAFVMFDGLDEVFDPGKREDIITCIHRFTNDYPNVRVIVTSRVIGYKPQRLRDAQFHHFMLQDLEPEQIKEFINRWHELTFNDEADKVRKRERLQRAIDTSKAIGELAGNPLLLTMMAILNRNQELPRDRPELYNQASRVLLHQWDVERALVEDSRLDPKTLDYKDKQAMLRQVAYHMQAAEKGLAGSLIRGDDLERILAGYLKSIEVDKAREVAKLMIHQLRVRNFILCHLGADYYAFVHRTFLEYFCAWEFVWQFKETQTLTIEQLKMDVFGKHWQDESWHEVLLLMAGMIDAKFVGEIIECLMAQKVNKREFVDEYEQLRKEGILNLLLAANCLAEVRNRTVIASVATQLQEALKKEVEQEYPYQFDLEAADAIVTAIATVWQDVPLTLNWLKFCIESDTQFYVPVSAVQAIAQNWKDDPDTLPILKQRATSDGNGSVRYAAVQELARGWKDDPDTLPLLKQWTTSNDNWIARRAAVQELARGWKDDPDTLPILKQRVTSDDDDSVRQAAVQELARGWKDDPDTLPILKQWATSDDNWAARQAAVQELARGWKDDPDTLPILKQRATSDDDDFVRQVAVQELAHGWKDESWMFEFLCGVAVNDPFERERDWQEISRQTALKAIIQNYPNHLQTLPLLQDRADNDPDEKVREFAREKLEELKGTIKNAESGEA